MSRDGAGLLPPGAEATSSPPQRQTGLYGAVVLGLVVIATVAAVMYYSLPPERQAPAHARAARPTGAEADVDRTVAVMADYRPQPRPGGRAAPPARPLATDDEPLGGPPPARAAGSPPPVPPQPDPPPAEATETDPLNPSDFTLGAILQSGDQAHALINDHLVSVGDEVGAARVVAINKYSVVLERDGKTLLLRL